MSWHCLHGSASIITSFTAATLPLSPSLAIFAALSENAAAGCYIDQFERRDGKWSIVFRHIAVEWTGAMQSGPIALDGMVEQISRLSSSRDMDDVSYLRPLAS
jgi:hypothetical protein